MVGSLHLCHFLEVLHVSLDTLSDFQRSLVDVQRELNVVKHFLDLLLLVICPLHFGSDASKNKGVEEGPQNYHDDAENGF